MTLQERGNILGSYGRKITQNKPKMIFSAGWKTSEHSKLGNHKSHVYETCLIYRPTWRLSLTKYWGCQSKGGRGCNQKTNKIWHEIKKVYTLKSHNISSKNGMKVGILFNVTLKVSRNKYMEKERRRVYAAHVGHKWNLTHICTTPILFVYHKIRVSMNGRVEGISKKPAKHGIELTIFLHFNIT